MKFSNGCFSQGSSLFHHPNPCERVGSQQIYQVNQTEDHRLSLCVYVRKKKDYMCPCVKRSTCQENASYCMLVGTMIIELMDGIYAHVGCLDKENAIRTNFFLLNSY